MWKIFNRFILFKLFYFSQKAALKKSGELSAKDGPITTAADEEDVWKKDFSTFKMASRITSMEILKFWHFYQKGFLILRLFILTL